MNPKQITMLKELLDDDFSRKILEQYEGENDSGKRLFRRRATRWVKFINDITQAPKVLQWLKPEYKCYLDTDAVIARINVGRDILVKICGEGRMGGIDGIREMIYYLLLTTNKAGFQEREGETLDERRLRLDRHIDVVFKHRERAERRLRAILQNPDQYLKVYTPAERDKILAEIKDAFRERFTRRGGGHLEKLALFVNRMGQVERTYKKWGETPPLEPPDSDSDPKIITEYEKSLTRFKINRQRNIETASGLLRDVIDYKTQFKPPFRAKIYDEISQEIMTTFERQIGAYRKLCASLTICHGKISQGSEGLLDQKERPVKMKFLQDQCTALIASHAEATYLLRRYAPDFLMKDTNYRDFLLNESPKNPRGQREMLKWIEAVALGDTKDMEKIMTDRNASSLSISLLETTTALDAARTVVHLMREVRRDIQEYLRLSIEHLSASHMDTPLMRHLKRFDQYFVDDKSFSKVTDRLLSCYDEISKKIATTPQTHSSLPDNKRSQTERQLLKNLASQDNLPFDL
ncbi:MAG: hypothetical protein V1746_05865 [bacterium]